MIVQANMYALYIKAQPIFSSSSSTIVDSTIKLLPSGRVNSFISPTGYIRSSLPIQGPKSSPIMVVMLPGVCSTLLIFKTRLESHKGAM